MLAHGSASLDASTGLVQLPAIVDPVFQRSNSNFQIPFDVRLLAAFAGGTGLTRARINTASLRLRGFPNIIPQGSALAPGTNPNILDFREYPLTLRSLEEYRIDITNGAANPAFVASLVADGSWNHNINASGLRWFRFTSSVTAVAVSWSNLGQITFEDVLEQGNYGVYGMQLEGANVLAGRLAFPNQLWRPGSLGNAAAGQRSADMFRGGLGLWGIFNTYAFPQVETLESAAGASTPAGYLLLARVGNASQPNQGS